MGKKIYLQSVMGYREDTLENWETVNPILHKGEVSIVRDSENGEWLKIGDGVTSWVDLPYKKWSSDSGLQIDQSYNPESENAQSGIAVAEALEFSKANDFEVIAEGELTEAVNSIKITTDKNGNPLALQDIFTIYFYSPKAEKTNYTTIKINNRLISQVPTMVGGAETYSKTYSVFNGYEWETFYVQAAPAGNGAVNTRGVTPFRTPQASNKTVSSIQLYCYASTDTMPVGFKYKIYGRRAK